MKKYYTLILCALLLLATGCSSKETKTLQGKGDGFGGEINVSVTLEDDKIVSVEVSGPQETEGIGSKAIEELPQRIIEKNSADVDIYSGATITSQGIIYAVNNAMDPEKYPYPQENASLEGTTWGLGVVSTPRVGPGKDDQEVQVYSFNQVFASVLFDKAGKILDLSIDQLEVATPNYDGDSMPHFSGFPNQSGYNVDKDHDGKVDGVSENSEQLFSDELNSWQTKRERGENYVMGTGYWYQQMDRYEELFIGKSVEEVQEWFEKYCSDLNGRPLKEGSKSEEDQTKYEALSDEEKAMLTDVTSQATMSLNDGHGNIIEAIQKAYENREAVDVKEATHLGLGFVSTPRVGPGKDDQEVQVYSFNEVVATTLFNENNEIIATYVDQVEVATPNYDGDSMPHFSGFPNQSGYNVDKDHDGKVDGVSENSEQLFSDELNSWQTKRERGENYVMGTGYWYQQMDRYEELFVGKSVEEVQEWFEKYCSDLNGRPLKEGSKSEEDQTKYEALSDEEKAMLTDVTSQATMSLNDSHGNIIEAIQKSFDHKEALHFNK